MYPTCYGELLAGTQGLRLPESETKCFLTPERLACPEFIEGDDLASGCGTPTHEGTSSEEEEHDRKGFGRKTAYLSSRQAMFAAGLPVKLPQPTNLSWDQLLPTPADFEPLWVTVGTPPGLASTPQPSAPMLPAPPSRWLAAAALDPAVAGAAEGAAAEDGGRRQRGARRRNMLQVATQLNKLDLLDPLRVVRVRKISRLGFGSSGLLREHFERWGPVEEVLLSGVEERPGGPQQRLRPSGFGFVVMASADAAQRALSESAQQLAGVWIEVHGFERLRPEAGTEPRTEQDGEAGLCAV